MSQGIAEIRHFRKSLGICDIYISQEIARVKKYGTCRYEKDFLIILDKTFKVLYLVDVYVST